jgi:hypothetical protein
VQVQEAVSELEQALKRHQQVRRGKRLLGSLHQARAMFTSGTVGIGGRISAYTAPDPALTRMTPATLSVTVTVSFT